MSRAVRLVLLEKKLDFSLQMERFFDKREDFLALNPLGVTPVFIDFGDIVLSDGVAILEYLEEVYPSDFLGATPLQRAEVRRVIGWFHSAFYYDVAQPLTFEKVYKRFLKQGYPDPAIVRSVKSELNYHMHYIGFLTEQRGCLAGPQLTMADFVVASYVSIIDFLGSIFWDQFDAAKFWYMRIKSRPSFRHLLTDQIPGISQPPHYQQLDF
jgi:glutathione S-transferase